MGGGRITDKVVWKIQGSKAFRARDGFGIVTALAIVLMIFAIFASGALAAELANLMWGPFSRTTYTVVTFGTGASFLLLAIQIAQRVGKGGNGEGRGRTARKLAPCEPGILELGFDRVATICQSWLGYFGLFFVIMLMSKLFRTGGGPGVKESYFWEMLILLGKGFGIPLAAVAAIIIILGLIEKRKRAAP